MYQSVSGAVDKGVQIVGIGGNDWNAIVIDGRELVHAW